MNEKPARQVVFGGIGHSLMPSSSGQDVIIGYPENPRRVCSRMFGHRVDEDGVPVPREVVAELLKKGFASLAIQGIDTAREEVVMLNGAGITYFREHNKYGERIGPIRGSLTTCAVGRRSVPTSGSYMGRTYRGR